ncbi:hypothetical protein [Sphingomonas sp.]|uniref:hypothetical protein n=1 Tax=Sphingomonas sp. TaxID=28214 RepID=UPI0031CFD62C
MMRSLFDFLSPSQITDYTSRVAQNAFSSAPDLSAAVQNAINTTYANGENLYCPAGAARIDSTLFLPEPPGSSTMPYDDRVDAWTMRGQGAAQAYVPIVRARGTVFVTNTDAPIFRYVKNQSGQFTSGIYEISHIRFEQINAEATATVIVFDKMSENASFHHNQVFQGGIGNGVDVLYSVKAELYDNFCIGQGYFAGPPATNTLFGIGFNIPSAYSGGALTVRKNSARAFVTGYVIGAAAPTGDSTSDPSATLLEQNEVSNCEVGVHIRSVVSSCTLDSMYFEGVRDTCVIDEGTSTIVRGGKFYGGFKVGIDSTYATFGNLYEGNYMETDGLPGATPPGCVFIDVLSDGSDGGPAKTVLSNTFHYPTNNVASVAVGVRVTGENPRVTIEGNAFSPLGGWTIGAGTAKIDNQSTGDGNFAITMQAQDGGRELPHLGQGSLSLGLAESALSQVSVSGSTLTIPPGSSFVVNATVPTNVYTINSGAESGRLIFLTVLNNNMTLNPSATLLLNGATAFSGPGTIVLLTRINGGFSYSYEISRTLF